MKKFIMLFIVLLFGITLAACKSNSTTGTTSTTKGTTAASTTGNTNNTNTTASTQPTYDIDTEITGPVKITFWHAFGGAKETILQGFVDEFTAANPNIEVELLSQGDYNGLRDKVIQAITTGAAPTMLIGYPDHVADYLQGNGVISLDPYINNPVVGFTQDEINDFVPAYLAENRQVDGITYGLPFNKSSEVMIYNKTYFDEHGLTVPTTWDEVQTVSQAIHNDTGKWGFSYDSAANLFITLTRQWGGQYTNSNGDLLFDNDQTKTALQYYMNMHDAGLFTIPAEWSQSYSTTNFINQDVYMTVGSTAGVGYNVPANGAFEIGCAPIPYKDADHKAVIQQGTNISIMSNSTSQERLAAWLLTKYLTSPDVTTRWAKQTGYLPVRLSALNSEDYQTFLNNPTEDEKYTAMAEKAAFQQVSYMFYDPAFVGSSNARNSAEIIMGNVLFGGYTPDEAIQEELYNLTN